MLEDKKLSEALASAEAKRKLQERTSPYLPISPLALALTPSPIP